VFDILIIRNRTTGVSKGYGFISCNNVKTYQRIVNTEHVINGRAIDCHDSFKKSDDPEKFKENANKKIFVGGISLETTDEDLHTYFSRFGDVRQAYVIKDPVTKRSKKFGFAIMKDQTAVDAVLAVPVHSIRGIPVSCKLFVRMDEDASDKATGSQEQVQKKSSVGKSEVKSRQDLIGIYPDGSGTVEQGKNEQVFPGLVLGQIEMSSSHYQIEDNIDFPARNSLLDSGLSHNSILQENNNPHISEGHLTYNPMAIEAASFSKAGISMASGQRGSGFFTHHDSKRNKVFKENPALNRGDFSDMSSAHQANGSAFQHHDAGLSSPADHRNTFGNKRGFRFEDAATGVWLRETKEGTVLLRGVRTTECFQPFEIRSIQAFIGECFNLRECLYRFNFCPLPSRHPIGLRRTRR
jgi:RNA recognition motif-containing protein